MSLLLLFLLLPQVNVSCLYLSLPLLFCFQSLLLAALADSSSLQGWLMFHMQVQIATLYSKSLQFSMWVILLCHSSIRELNLVHFLTEVRSLLNYFCDLCSLHCIGDASFLPWKLQFFFNVACCNFSVLFCQFTFFASLIKFGFISCHTLLLFLLTILEQWFPSALIKRGVLLYQKIDFIASCQRKWDSLSLEVKVLPTLVEVRMNPLKRQR